MINTYKILVGNPEGKKLFGRPKRISKDVKGRGYGLT
jgi:hypothetical protein